MRHPTYKHLETRLRLGAFSLGQWAQITAAAASAALFGGYLSPFPTQVTIFISILGAGLPVAISYGAMGMEFSVSSVTRASWRYWRNPHRYLAGPGRTASGYVLLADPTHDRNVGPDHATPGGAVLWDV